MAAKKVYWPVLVERDQRLHASIEDGPQGSRELKDEDYILNLTNRLNSDRKASIPLDEIDGLCFAKKAGVTDFLRAIQGRIRARTSSSASATPKPPVAKDQSDQVDLTMREPLQGLTVAKSTSGVRQDNDDDEVIGHNLPAKQSSATVSATANQIPISPSSNGHTAWWVCKKVDGKAVRTQVPELTGGQRKATNQDVTAAKDGTFRVQNLLNLGFKEERQLQKFMELLRKSK